MTNNDRLLTYRLYLSTFWLSISKVWSAEPIIPPRTGGMMQPGNAACPAMARQRPFSQQPQEALQSLPLGTQIAPTRKPDGTWAGMLIASGTKVEAVGDGPHGLTVNLARLWLSARGAEVRPDPKAE